MELITTLQNLEPLFKEAGQLAYQMQKTAKSHYKYQTGNATSDIVTEADFAVQEFLLKAMLATDLKNCHLLAEEDTELTKEFNENGTYYLSIDPIDDTRIYANGDEHFSTIIALHDGQQYLYTFVYFPAWDWGHRITEGKHNVMGEGPKKFPTGLEKTIIYWSGVPEEHIPKELYEDLLRQGVVFKKVKDIGSDFGSIALVAMGKAFGIYHEDMNAYDAMTEFSIAKAKKWKIFSSDINLKNIQKRTTGLYYPGWYLALCK